MDTTCVDLAISRQTCHQYRKASCQPLAFAISYQFAGPVQHQVDDLLADGVVSAGIVVSCVFFASDELLGVEQLPVGTCAHLICRTRKGTLQLRALKSNVK